MHAEFEFLDVCNLLRRTSEDSVMNLFLLPHCTPVAPFKRASCLFGREYGLHRILAAALYSVGRQYRPRYSDPAGAMHAEMESVPTLLPVSADHRESDQSSFREWQTWSW